MDESGRKVDLKENEYREHVQALVAHSGFAVVADPSCLESNHARSLIAANLVQDGVAEPKASNPTERIAEEVDSTRIAEVLDSIPTEGVRAGNNSTHQNLLETSQ